MVFNVFNAVGFQLAWWASMWGAAHAMTWAAAGVCAVLALAHGLASPVRGADLKLAALSVLCGLLVDSGLQAAGVMQFKGWAVASLSPCWLWCVWAWFGLTLNHAMAFLQGRPHWAAGLGAVFGPVSYGAGAAAGAASMPGAWGGLAIAAVWAALMPLLAWAAFKLRPS